MNKTPARHTHAAVAEPKTQLLLENNDCAVKALAVATGFSYDDCWAFWALHGRKPRRGTYTYRTLDRGAKDFPELGFRSVRVGGVREKRDVRWNDATRRYEDCSAKPDGWTDHGTTLRTFCREHPKGRFLVTVSQHALAVVDGVVYDYCARDLRRIRDVWQIERL